MVTNMLAYALSGSLNNLFCIYCWYKLINEKVPWKNYKFYIILFILTILGMIINFLLPQFIKIILMVLLLFIANLILLHKRLDETIMAVLISEFTVMISEFICVMCISLLAENSMLTISQNPIGISVINISIALIAFLILKTKLPVKIYNYSILTLSNVKDNILIICSIITVIISALFMTLSYMKLPSLVILFVNTMLVLVYAFIIIKLAYTNDKFRKINNKYETSLSSLKEYESIMNNYRVDNHENKNQLLTIRNMVKANDKTTIKYIDKLVDNRINDNENIFYKTSKIPEGGLRATIYAKLCKMKDAGIEYSLEIANDVRTVDLINLNDDTMLSICKIVGVFLDNAIEAVEGLDEKDIIVEIFIMDNNLCIEISNNYKENIELDKISNKGYSTKGNGHGYGLSLVKKIVDNNELLENEREISKDLFTQRLKIKM